MDNAGVFGSREVWFSYSQLVIFDSAVELPFLDWRDAHVRQGFARTERVVAVGTLLEAGKCCVEVMSDAPSDREVRGFERATLVPIEVPSGALRVEGVEADWGDPIPVPKGHYEAIVAQRTVVGMSGRLEMRIWLRDAPSGSPQSKILVADQELRPPSPLVETAEFV